MTNLITWKIGTPKDRFGAIVIVAQALVAQLSQKEIVTLLNPAYPRSVGFTFKPNTCGDMEGYVRILGRVVYAGTLLKVYRNGDSVDDTVLDREVVKAALKSRISYKLTYKEPEAVDTLEQPVGDTTDRKHPPLIRPSDWSGSCDTCKYQEGRHFCCVYGTTIKNMDTVSCKSHRLSVGVSKSNIKL